jgi:hypothetical protein
MFTETKTEKDKRLLSTEDITVQTKGGRLPILIKHQRNQPVDSIKNTVSTSEEHSISDQDFQ